MEINFIEPEDYEQISRIYYTFFNEMEFIDFYKKFHCAFKVTENDITNKIIAVGGIRPITEAVLLTDRSFSTRDKMEALLKIFEGIKYSANKLGYNQIHAFSYEPEYIRHLKNRMGFKCNEDNKVLTLDLHNG